MRPPALAVLLPAHNEEKRLPRAPEAISAAALHPALRQVRTITVVAADSCEDGTVEAAARANSFVVRVEGRNVGLARSAAARRALKILDGPARVWFASTDADSVVPADWLAFQYARACEGWDAVVGTVTVTHWPHSHARLAARHQLLYTDSRPPYGPWRHPHVHGANLGVSAQTYAAVGGFPPLPVSEDRGLVAALSAREHRVLRTAECPVATSGRLCPRAADEFGDHLAFLALQAGPRP